MPEFKHNKQNSSFENNQENDLMKAEQQEQNKFIREKIKERPVNNKKLIRRSVTTAAMAVIFGLIACFTFLVLEPVFSKWLYPDEEAKIVVFPEDQEEMSPEEMISGGQTTLTNEQWMGLKSDELDALSSRITAKKDHYRQIYGDMSKYVEELSRSMVNITAVSSNTDWFSSVEESSNQAAGLIIADNGRELLILTQYQPLKKAENLMLSFHTGLSVEATLKGFDSSTNMAVVAVDRSQFGEEFLKKEIKIASMGSSNLSALLGTPVVALGSPLGINDSMGYGMISVISDYQTEADMEYKLLQTDIMGSASGEGFLFNLQGQVVGVITNDKSATDMKNMVTAYGITELKKRIEKISNNEKIAYLGITGVDVTKEANEEHNIPYGAYITKLDMNSPAMMIGIHDGDIIVEMRDKEIKSYKDYVDELLQCKVNETVEITVMRQNQSSYKKLSFSVMLGEND